jgi:hypothetical protein
MGSTMCKGGSLQEVYNLIKSNYPNPKIRIIQMIIQCYKVYKRYTRDIQDIQYTRYTKDINNSHPRAKHAPSGTYSTWTAFTGN